MELERIERRLRVLENERYGVFRFRLERGTSWLIHGPATVEHVVDDQFVALGARPVLVQIDEPLEGEQSG